MKDSITTAAELVEYLFTNGAGDEADTLDLMQRVPPKHGHPTPSRNLGGWSRAAILAAVEQLVASVLSVERQRLRTQHNQHDLKES